VDISIEFLNRFIDLAMLTEVMAALFSTIFLYKYKNGVLRYFPLLLWYMVINEFMGLYSYENTTLNKIIYNIYILINFVFFFYVYKRSLKKKIYKICIDIFIYTYLISVLIFGFYENYLVHTQSIPYIIAAGLLLITITFYFTELLNSDMVMNVKTNLLFWVSVGLLLYFVGNIPFRIVKNYYGSINTNSILYLVNIILTIVLNFCYIIGFLWIKKK